MLGWPSRLLVFLVAVAFTAMIMPAHALCFIAETDPGHQGEACECVCACHGPVHPASVTCPATPSTVLFHVIQCDDATIDILAAEIFQPPKIRS
jgi:hypothetical protein